ANETAALELPVRFKAVQHLGFPGRPIEKVDTRTSPPTAYVNVMGLTGTMGVLPHHMTQEVLARLREGDTGLADFLDILNHRLLVLLYRSWAHYRLCVQARQNDLPQDPITRLLQSFAGQPFDHTSPAPRYYSGHFARRVRCAESLQRVLSDWLELPVQAQQFVGKWLALPNQARIRLGQTPVVLGKGLILGQRCWDVSHHVTLHLGPVDYATYQALLPGVSGTANWSRLSKPMCQLISK
ncbi:MAG: type VI secretion system baseplate subunit TssG, partial [Limnobacter sp.]|nr:type VI secretion system baseplate subunit TssG [Limnobacter sp.]